MGDRRYKILKVVSIAVGISFLLFVVVTVSSFFGRVGQRRSDASKFYLPQIEAAYLASMNARSQYLEVNPMFEYIVSDFIEIENEYGAVEEYESDFIEPHMLGSHHYFSFKVKRNGVWSGEWWVVNHARPFNIFGRAEPQSSD